MRRIVLSMSRQAAMDLDLHEGKELTHAGRSGRVVGMSLTDDNVVIELEVGGRVALTGVPGEPPDAEADDA